MLIAALLSISLIGCGKKEKDAATQQVLKITITPTPVITPEAEEINPNAIVTKDNVTMTNLYLLENPDAAPTPLPVTPTPEGTNADAQSESNESSNESDSSENTEDSSDDSYDSYDDSYDDYSEDSEE
ncbi:MAG: hypothetical protein Q4B47_03910 [Eubacteriales bacterium]|nr:hypothetical protein [Eubacteriales bacterium]